MRLKSGFILLLVISVVLTACGPNASQLAATYVAATMASTTQRATNTPLPSDTPQPSATSTPLPTSTATLVATATELPTETPTVTATPGPFSFLDDFTSDSGGWADCEQCKWENGSLIMGPFEPASTLHKNYCTGCGTRTYYKISVDATFVEGQVDRFFGVFVGDVNGEQYYFGISPWQFYAILKHTDEGGRWEVMNAAWSGIVNPSYATNHFEVSIQPAYERNTGDYVFSLNGTNLYIIYGIPVSPSKAGLAMDYHAVTAGYDNWEYVEIIR